MEFEKNEKTCPRRAGFEDLGFTSKPPLSVRKD
jgi:hypothetical protein